MSSARIQPTACALSSTIKHHLRPLRNAVVFTATTRSGTNTKKPLSVSMSASAPPNPLEICVKASITAPNKLGDCKKLNIYWHIVYQYI